MPDLTAKRTLVKSPPELWEELSAVEGLTKHLGAFGEIKITKLEPEHTVAWEGEHASGTVSIEPSGWGTKVTLHAELQEGAAEPEVVEAAEPEAVDASEPETAAPTAVEPEPVEPEPVEPEPAEPEPAEAEAADLEAVEPETAAPTAAEPEPQAEPSPKRRGFWGWLFRDRTASQTDSPAPVAVEPPRDPAPPVEPELVAVAAEPEPVAEEPEPVQAEAEPVSVAPEPEPVPEEPEAAADEPDDAPIDPDRARLVLDEALDALGAAHHRPFSRG